MPPIITLVLAIAADLRAGNYGQLVADFLALIQLLASAGVPTPKASQLFQVVTHTNGTTSIANIITELETWANAHVGKDVLSFDWAALLAALLKLLPFIIGGL